MIRSQPSARLQPAPTAAPLTAAIVGFGISCSRRTMRPSKRIECTALPTPPLAALGSFLSGVRSAPDVKASPAPVSTSTRSLRVIAISSNVSVSSRTIVVLIAFFFSGRFIVTVTTPWSSRSTSKVSMWVRYFCGLQPVSGAREAPRRRRDRRGRVRRRRRARRRGALRLLERRFDHVAPRLVAAPRVHGRHVEPQLDSALWMLVEPARREPAQPALLRDGHRFEGLTERVAAARLHLAEHD